MTTERFPKADFEAVLGDSWMSEGIIMYEECYTIPLTPQARIWIRSSVGRKGVADGTGEDSIRTYLQVYQPSYKTGQYDWFPLKSIPDKKVYRTPSWRENLARRLDELSEPGRRLTSKITPCPKCGNIMYVAISGSEKNPGRPYASCNEKYGGCGKFLWLDKDSSTKLDDVMEWVDEGSRSPIVDNLASRTLAQDRESRSDSIVQGILDGINTEAIDKILREKKQDRVLSPQDQELKTSLQSLKQQFSVQLNESQEAFVRADIDQDIVLLAPPGSGKTKCIEERYAFLVRQGISPENILVVTFSKPMADEMAKRIQSITPEAKLDYISTIHAFCYRALTKWYADSPYYGFVVPTKDNGKYYDMVKTLEEIISTHWSEADGDEVPGWSEIDEYISFSKLKGATLDECYDVFLELFGGRKELARKLTQIRTKFDWAMKQKRYISFTDMIYLMERMLIENVPFRLRLQKRFSHVIVDEGQDTAHNALRILITVSMDVGQNTVYGEMK